MRVSSTTVFWCCRPCSLSRERGDAKTPRKRNDEMSYSVCEHLTLSEGHGPKFLPIQIPELAKDEATPSLFRPCNQSFGSCTLCLTDYSIDISWRGERKEYVIEVRIYRQLGDCRSPNDWSWCTMSTRRTDEEPRTAGPEEHRPGVVRDRRNRANSIASRNFGRWAELPGFVAKRRWRSVGSMQ